MSDDLQARIDSHHWCGDDDCADEGMQFCVAGGACAAILDLDQRQENMPWCTQNR